MISNMDAIDRLTRVYAAGAISLNEMRRELGYEAIEGGDELTALKRHEEMQLITEMGQPHVVSTKKVGQSYRVFFDRSEIEALGLEVGDIVEVDARVVCKAPPPEIEGDSLADIMTDVLRNNKVKEITSACAEFVNSDDMINLIYALPAVHRNNACIIVNSNTELELRKLKDGNGRYVWEWPNIPGKPKTLMGYPLYNQESMPDIPKRSKTAVVAIIVDLKAFREGMEVAAVKLRVPKRVLDELHGDA